MEYTIQKVAKLSGISTRTLRYYDQIDLLNPARLNPAGYRIYGTEEIDRLQQILFYKKLGIKLDEIKMILDAPDFNIEQALLEHQKNLLSQKKQIELLLNTVDRTIHYYKGEIQMTDTEKFKAFKIQTIQQNEDEYGDQIREAYDEKTIEQANEKWKNMSEEDYNKLQQAEEELIDSLNQLLRNNLTDLNHPFAKKAFHAHKSWLMIASSFYNQDYHRSLAEMYVSDERFSQYYNQRTSENSADLLKEIIFHYTND